MSLGSFLRSERKLKGYTQEDAANAAGVVAPVVSKWENDKSVPDLASACALCRLLDLRIDELVGERRNNDLPRVLPPEAFDPRILGETCKKLRIKNGLSQGEVGARLYVTSQTVSKWESGGITLLDTFVKVAEFYNISPVELLCGQTGEDADAARATPTTKASRKKLFVRIAAVLCCVLLTASALVGGFFIGKRFSESNNATTPSLDNTDPDIGGGNNSGDNNSDGNGGGNTDTPAIKPSKPQGYVTLTYHFPDGTTESHTIKAGELSYVEPSYNSRDVACLWYKGEINGTETFFAPRTSYYNLTCDVDLYPEYRTKWVDFSDTKSQHDRELFYDVESLLESIENYCGNSFNILFEVAVSNVENEDWQGSVFAHVGREEFDDTYSIFADACARLCDTVKDAEYFTWAAERIQTLFSLADSLKTDMLDYLLSARYPFEDDEYREMTDEERNALHLPVMEYVLNNFGERYLQLACLMYDSDDKFQCVHKGICRWYDRYTERLGKERVNEVLGI